VSDYPASPGFKETGGTSERAAAEMAARAPTLRAAALSCLSQVYPWGLTADEIATRLGETPFAMRPRLTELFTAGLIRKGPGQRHNVSGKRAWVWHCAFPPNSKQGVLL